MNDPRSEPSPRPRPRPGNPRVPPSWPISEKPSPTPLVPREPPQAPPAVRQPISWNKIAPWALLGLIALIGVIDMPALYWGGDPAFWREETRSILYHGTLQIDPRTVPFAGERGQTLVVNEVKNQLYVKFGLMNSLMSLPPMLLDMILHGQADSLTLPDRLISGLWNVALSVALAAVLWRITGLYTDRTATRIVFVLSVFYGTFLWNYVRAQSSEIFQTLFYSAAFLLLVKFLRQIRLGRVNLWRLHLAWLLIAMLVLTRILYLMLIPLVFLYVAVAILRIERGRRIGMVLRLLPHLVGPPIAIVVLLGWINNVKFGSPFFTGYHQWHPESHLPNAPLMDGLRGLFIEPRLNILLYFPVLPFALLAIVPFVRRFTLDALVAIGTAAVFILVLAKIPTWAGEWTYGPRYFLFMLPVLSLPMLLFIDWVIDHRRNVLAWLACATACASLGYYSYLQFHVNEITFLVYYYVRMPIEPKWTPAVHDYFMNHHVGWLTTDMLAHRDDVDSMPWFIEMKPLLTPEQVESYRANVRQLLNTSNHLWWNAPPPSPSVLSVAPPRDS